MEPTSHDVFTDVVSELSGNDEMLFANGFNEALIGYVERSGLPPLALYDADKCIEIIMEKYDLPYDEARDSFNYNTKGSYVGENTPAFATILVK